MFIKANKQLAVWCHQPYLWKHFSSEVIGWCLLKQMVMFLPTLVLWDFSTAYMQPVQNTHRLKGWVFLRALLKLKNRFKSAIVKIMLESDAAVEIWRKLPFKCWLRLVNNWIAELLCVLSVHSFLLLTFAFDDWSCLLCIFQPVMPRRLFRSWIPKGFCGLVLILWFVH